MMTNTLAIATVTAGLQYLLQSSIRLEGLKVTIGAPKPPDPGHPSLLNIFLYQTTPNLAYRNADLPTRSNSDSQFTQKPQVALNLHYLLSFYGKEENLIPQRLLGQAMQTLHTQPILNKALIDSVTKNIPPGSRLFPFLENSTLAEQTDRVRFTLQSIALEDLTRIWSAFFQSIPYTLSATYQASPILMRDDVVVKVPKEVLTPHIAMDIYEKT